MKTIRTIIATLSVVLLSFALVAWFSVRRNAAFIQRTIYQGFDQTFVVALVMGCAFLLIAIILTVAIMSTEGDDEDQAEDEDDYRPRPRTRPVPREEQPYRRVSRSVEQNRSRREEEIVVRSRSKAEAKPSKRRPEEPAPRKRERVDELDQGYREAPVKKKAKAVPVWEPEEERPPVRRKPNFAADSREEQPPVRRKPNFSPAADPDLEAERPEAPTLDEAPEIELEAVPEPEAAGAKEAPEAENFDEPQDEPADEPQDEPSDEPADEPASAPEALREDTVRCVFCGAQFPRSSQVCPVCGKKR